MLIQQIKEDIKQAMRDKEKVKLSTLRMLLSTIETERGKKGISTIEDFSQDEIIGFINRNIKQLDQEIDSILTAERDPASQYEQRTILQAYLPKQLTDEEIIAAVAKVIQEAENVGQAMKLLSSLRGKADMKKVSQFVKEGFKNK